MRTLRFVVHEHHASRLHFDFRLERVDDHALEYGEFEGIIPEGNYGAGPVVVWDRGTYELLEGTDPLAALAKGSMKFALSGKRLKGTFALVKLHGPRATGKEWLLMKKADAAADPGFRLVSALTPAKRKQLAEYVPPCATS